ncbi:hypothetical protein LSH36_1114g00030 [Paralvinella palmiformis]|uniref:Protein Wnt n=1 Tax=Paralvinella palmiformis TaxID=53620 RepID=A0AAD9IVA0_9ANNE|nr:hypothetical protein LSH36_1114g00030 [Paralvinella palmiformis]
MLRLSGSGLDLQVVQDSLTTACKCHGVSGSCSIKTCWMALPDMRSIGVTLQKRYAVAVEVKKRKQKRGKRRKPPSMPQETSNLVAVTPGRRRFTDSDLVYYTKSPDYCYPDPALGSLGTHGRECKKDLAGSGGCKSMCCGRGYTSEIVRVRHRCDCKYYWCCYVKCKTCTKEVEINKCK